jgi:CheY-like chemotaxis protein
MSLGKGVEVTLILIVEDDPNLRAVIRMVLERAGYEVAEAKNGLDGLQSIERETPELVIADMIMPVMNGIELVERIRSNPKTASIPIVLLSGREVDRPAAALVNAVVTKPFEPADLLARINRALQADGTE